MNAFVSWVVARAKEPSTYNGIGLFIGGLTFIPSSDLSIAVKAVAAAAVAVPAILGVVLPEAK